MKKRIFAAALISLQLQASAQSWVAKQSGLPARHGIIDIAAPDGLNAYAIAFDADNWLNHLNEITITHNSGNTWNAQKIPQLTGMRITGLGTSTGTTVHVIAWNPAVLESNVAGGKVVRSTTGGIFWAQEGANTFTNQASFPDDIAFLNALDGVMFGDPVAGYFEIYTTGNGGNTWAKVDTTKIPKAISTDSLAELGSTFVMEKFGNTFVTATVVFNIYTGIPAYGRLLQSDDKGKTWYVKNPNLPISGWDVTMKFRNSSVALLKNDNKLYRTTNGGTTWTQVNYTGPYHEFDLDDVPGKAKWWISTGGNLGIATTSKGSSISYDDGNTWKAIDTITHSCVQMVNYAQGYAGGISTNSSGSNGIYVYRPGLFDIFKSLEENTINNQVTSSQAQVELNIYPNPSSESFTLSLNSPEARFVLIRVINAQGVTVLSQRAVPVGTVSFGADLAPGIYTAEVIIDTNKSTFQIVKQ